MAQEEKKGTETKTGEKAVKGKLPNHFDHIGLTKKQEEDVRSAAKPFDEQIVKIRKQVDELEKQIHQLEADKATACEQKLTELQKASLKERRETTAKEAAAKKKDKKAADGEENKSPVKKTGN